MRLLKSQKGQIRIIEAFFASALVLSSLMLIPAGTDTRRADDQSLSSKARDILMTLDGEGYLSKLIENRSWTTLSRCVESFLSPTIWFNVTVLDENGLCLNDVAVSNGGPTNGKISAADYMCASVSSNFKIYVVRLQLSPVD